MESALKKNGRGWNAGTKIEPANSDFSGSIVNNRMHIEVNHTNPNELVLDLDGKKVNDNGTENIKNKSNGENENEQKKKRKRIAIIILSVLGGIALLALIGGGVAAAVILTSIIFFNLLVMVNQ